MRIRFDGILRIRLSFVIDGAETHLAPTIIQRDDVGQFYNNDFTFCGWDFDSTNAHSTDVRIECQYDDTWNVAFVIIREKIYTVNTRTMPSFLVIDDFYNNVDAVRELALSQTFVLRPERNKGQRTDAAFRFGGVKERQCIQSFGFVRRTHVSRCIDIFWQQFRERSFVSDILL